MSNTSLFKNHCDTCNDLEKKSKKVVDANISNKINESFETSISIQSHFNNISYYISNKGDVPNIKYTINIENEKIKEFYKNINKLLEVK